MRAFATGDLNARGRRERHHGAMRARPLAVRSCYQPSCVGFSQQSERGASASAASPAPAAATSASAAVPGRQCGRRWLQGRTGPRLSRSERALRAAICMIRRCPSAWRRVASLVADGPRTAGPADTARVPARSGAPRPVACWSRAGAAPERGGGRRLQPPRRTAPHRVTSSLLAAPRPRADGADCPRGVAGVARRSAPV